MGVVRTCAAGFLLVLSLALVPPLEATEFSLFEPSARAAGLGGAFVARADNVFALAYNPAGIAFLDGLRLETGCLINTRTMTVSAAGTDRRITSDPFQFWGTAALSWQPWPWVTLGVGYFSPYSARFIWPWTWAAEKRSINMKFSAHYLRPAVAFRLPGNLAVGAGLDIVFSDVLWVHEITSSLGRFPQLPTIRAESRNALSGHGLGFSCGFLWKAHRLFQVGAKYQHPVAIDYRGEDIFESRTPLPPLIPHPTLGRLYYNEFFSLYFKRQNMTSTLSLPRDIVCGVLIAPVPNLSLTFDVQWTAWHKMGPWEFVSVNADGDINPEFTPLYQEFYGLTLDYGRQDAGIVLKDARKFKGGVEYRLFGRFGLRAGLARHESAVKAGDLNPVYPDLDRTVLSLGFGHEGPFYSIWDRKEMGQISADVYFQYIWAKKTTSSLSPVEMTYQGDRWILGVGVGFIF